MKEEQTFPRLTVNWGRANRLPYIKKVLNSAQMSGEYSKTRTLEGEGSLSSRDLLEQSDSQRTQVSWNGQWRFGPTTRISHSRDSGTDLDFELVSAQDTLAAGAKPRRSAASGSSPCGWIDSSCRHRSR